MRPGQTVYFDDAEWVVVQMTRKSDGVLIVEFQMAGVSDAH